MISIKKTIVQMSKRPSHRNKLGAIREYEYAHVFIPDDITQLLGIKKGTKVYWEVPSNAPEEGKELICSIKWAYNT